MYVLRRGSASDRGALRGLDGMRSVTPVPYSAVVFVIHIWGGPNPSDEVRTYSYRYSTAADWLQLQQGHH